MVAGASALSVCIITLDEERRLPACLASLPPDCEIIIVDSGSTDRTADIARAFGAVFVTRPFVNYADQKNAALALASRPWVLSLDADEVLDEALRRALCELCALPPQTSAAAKAWHVRRRLVFMDRALRFGKAVDQPLRLLPRGAGRFESAIHESLVATVPDAGRLPGELLHYSYDDISDYFRRFNNYTTKVAANHLAASRPSPSIAALAVRPWLEFVTRYVFRLGMLDGYPGYCYALFSALYAFVKHAKLRELHARRSDA